MAEEPSKQVPGVWVEQSDPRMAWVNSFVVTTQPGEMFLTFGQVTPPAILGATPEERAAQLAQIDWVPIHTVAKIAMTRARAQELLTVLEDVIAKHDAMPEEE